MEFSRILFRPIVSLSFLCNDVHQRRPVVLIGCGIGLHQSREIVSIYRTDIFYSEIFEKNALFIQQRVLDLIFGMGDGVADPLTYHRNIVQCSPDVFLHSGIIF